MKSTVKTNKEIKELHDIIYSLFPIRFILDDKGRRNHTPFIDENKKATEHRQTLCNIVSEHYNGHNKQEVKTRITSRAKRILIYPFIH